MKKKYELVKSDTIKVSGHKLYRIKSLIDFGYVKKGGLGGYIEDYRNLSQEGNCWVYDNAMVYEDAIVKENSSIHDNAKIYGHARIYGNAEIGNKAEVYDSAEVLDFARVFDYAKVHGNARVSGNAVIQDCAEVFDYAVIYDESIVDDSAKVYGVSIVKGSAEIYGEAKVYGMARVSGHANVCGNAEVFGDAEIYGYANIYGNAKIYNEETICRGSINKPLDDIKYSLAVQLGVLPDTNGYVTLYKKVMKISDSKFHSLFDTDFIYEIGKIAKVKNPDERNIACSSGIHLSTPLYWHYGDTIIECKVHINDIITVQRGKVRCRKCKVIREVNI